MFFIDDSNTTIQYFTSSTGIPWNHKVPGIANNSADAKRCYGQTYVNQNLCSNSDMCHFRIPFTGSGISIFVIQSNDPLNATMTIDGDTPTIATMAALSGSSNPLAYNVTFYTRQSLTPTAHTLGVVLSDYTDGTGRSKGSMIRFDAAAVDETSPTSHSSSAMGPIIGGTVGGLAVIAAVIFALLFYRRRSSRNATVFDSQPYPEYTALSTETKFAGSNPETSTMEPSSLLEATATGSSSPPLSNIARSSGLTEKEAEYLNHLRSSNIPPVEIAYLMEILRGQREGSLSVGGSHGNAIPRGYDFKSSN